MAERDLPRMKLWFPASVGLLAVGGLLFLHLQAELERNLKSWLTLVVVLLALLAGFVWFLVQSRVSKRVRLMTLGVVVLGAWGATRLVRVDGTLNGTGLPRLVWRWSAETPAGSVAAPQPASVPAATVSVAGLSDVPQFFGPNRDGLVRGAGLARDWNVMAPKLLWRQPIGPGWSSFAVVGGRAYTQEQRGDEELVTCYDVGTGRLQWAHTNSVRFSQWQGGPGPRATPTVAQGQVFTFGATGILDCLAATNGQRVWTRAVLKEHHLPNLLWGVSCSPLVFEETVVVTGGLTNGPTLLAYQRQTGRPLWQVGNDKASYASPVLAVVAGQRVILSANAGSLTAHEPATGRVLLDYSWASDKWPKAAQPVVAGEDRVFLSAGYGVGCVLLQVNRDPGGRLSAKEVWRGKTMKTQFNTAAVRDGFLYGLDDGGLACVDLATGQRRWKDGRYGSGQSLLVADLLLIQSEAGDVVLAQASPEAFRELARLPALRRKTWNYPTLAGRFLLVRNDQEAACYELPGTARP